MNIIIAGATGFIGRHLVKVLLRDKHRISVIGRSTEKIQTLFGQQVIPVSWNALDALNPDLFDVVINLAGENIGEKRWSGIRKKEIIDSRVKATDTLARWCAKANKKPHLYNASAIGVYGLQPLTDSLPARLTEQSATPAAPYPDFVSEVGALWEAAVNPAREAGVPVTFLRFGVVLKKDEGALKKMQPSFQFGMGGSIGKGTQAFSWVHLDDVIGAITYLMQHPNIVGPVNVCSPHCVMQKDFAKTLAASMHRPCILKTPAWVLLLMFGQMAHELLLNGQYVYPEVLLEAGYPFVYPELKTALEREYGD